ncbi:hypothetical protein ADM90_11105 [Lysinibacillus macroides]|uniref:Uncharacterized protein n=1 Tax=Lysinibacillus macroides TaxID=33935 RepID=A0A0M9DJU7_9BACI|nr:hypothetical protein ADM90_20930 [Lysinibacillus macroides]KOY80437.1 hypothetical protein ADM90_21640 [Lysinibacillus macroides]KOY80956.1 hypothetical protein ADM90_17465 [Lysinibacillus macroides]KOY81886.1 hypothetical protein ADM90_13325 [Lysinibacillus macroides]KOY82180.1 hypothetical protein ADM90_11105 [Lysinibacillus macroides]
MRVRKEEKLFPANTLSVPLSHGHSLSEIKVVIKKDEVLKWSLLHPSPLCYKIGLKKCMTNKQASTCEQYFKKR